MLTLRIYSHDDSLPGSKGPAKLIFERKFDLTYARLRSLGLKYARRNHGRLIAILDKDLKFTTLFVLGHMKGITQC